jgi:hypothetical protein
MRNPIVRQIVGRCFIGDSNLKVIRYTISRLKNGYNTFSALSKEVRKDLLRQIIKEHAENKSLFNSI